LFAASGEEPVVIYHGIAKGKMIELEEPLPYKDGQAISVLVQPIVGHPGPGSPGALLKAIRQPPHVTAEDVEALESAIREAELPVSPGDIFDAQR
jgi:hypothetical protein